MASRINPSYEDAAYLMAWKNAFIQRLDRGGIEYVLQTAAKRIDSLKVKLKEVCPTGIASESKSKGEATRYKSNVVVGSKAQRKLQQLVDLKLTYQAIFHEVDGHTGLIYDVRNLGICRALKKEYFFNTDGHFAHVYSLSLARRDG